jgi:hypothetical protein
VLGLWLNPVEPQARRYRRSKQLVFAKHYGY